MYGREVDDLESRIHLYRDTTALLTESRFDGPDANETFWGWPCLRL